ncbi:exonuclease 3'-5' domain-containing protein 2 [Neodiprion pinetum]|uniref:exonuclease 3'-5' domain-containing protein 2 n=1 Tax=Neodiprion pinetum TaxID=441929 RepID=UPI001EDFDBED|nr:exonuclease 3'-5' domain-containing protein 2 [Neodiprion pinetum]
MFQFRKDNIFFVCMTVGLALVASKYRNNVLRSLRQFCQNVFLFNKNLSIEDRNFYVESDKVILVKSPEKCDYALQRIRHELSDGVLGFDCEWVNDERVSLLQLATSNGLCVLFRLDKIGYVPGKLKELLSNKRVLKVGVAPFDDGRKLTRDFGCHVYGTLDLREHARRLGIANATGLAALCKEYLGIEMDKNAAVRRSNWNADSLTKEQINYAASDAFAAVLIYHQMLNRAQQQRSLWGNFVINLKNIWDQSNEDKLLNLPQGELDMRFRANPNNLIQKNNQETNNTNLKIKNKSTVVTRNKPLYHNCYLQAPDGDTLCTCDHKKATWYVEKGLGTVVQEEPYTVRLKFEPSGRAQGEVGRYYTQVKINRCVVCGATDKFIRKNVVPREYRKYFPVVMKEHQSHDVLLLCPTCHQISNMQDIRMRKRLAEMCDAPLSGPSISVDDAYQSHWRRLRSAVRALRKESSLPNQRRLILESHVSELTGHKEITPQLLDELDQQIKATQPSVSVQTGRTPHGLKVVEHFESQPGGLVELEQLWREHFLSAMEPKYMPELWSVCHNQERLLIRLQQRRIEPQDAKLAGILESDQKISCHA